MEYDHIRKLWDQFIEQYNDYFKSNEEIWLETLEKVRIYININNAKPSRSNKNNDIQYLNTWLTNQKFNYIKNRYLMNQSDIKIKWEQFMDDYKEYFAKN